MAKRPELLLEMREITKKMAILAEKLHPLKEADIEETARILAEISKLLADRQRIIEEIDSSNSAGTLDDQESLRIKAEIKELNEQVGKVLNDRYKELAESVHRLREGKQVLAYLTHTQTTGLFLDRRK